MKLFQNKKISHCRARFWLVAVFAFVGAAHAQVVGTGSYTDRDLLASLAQQFGTESGSVSYTPSSSSAGVQAARNQTVDFGVTNVPLTAAALNQAGLLQLPIAGSAIAVVVNLPEIGAQPLKLNGDVLASIYLGVINQWNHTQIAAINPGVKLPARAIVPVWRSDGAGSQYVFTTYLSRHNTTWRRGNGQTYTLSLQAGRSVPNDVEMINTVRSNPGAIGFDALGSALRSGLKIAALQNKDSKFVVPSIASVQAAMTQARWNNADLTADLDGIVGQDLYPLSVVVYAVIPRTPAASRKRALPFLQASVARGDANIRQVNYVALPVQAKSLVAGVKQ